MNHAVVRKATVTTALTGTFLSLPALASAHFGNELLYKGMRDEHVTNVQNVLMNEGYYKPLKATGYFGTATEKAVLKFQRDHGLRPDGIVGPKTKAKLSHYVKFDGKLLAYGSQGEAVKDVQYHLKDLRFYNGEIDGIFGKLTRLAVLRFQKSRDLSIDGIVGPETFKALHDAELSAEARLQASVQAKNGVQTRRVIGSATKVYYMNATAYTAYCTGCSGVTATGIDLRTNPDAKVVAVDPDIIPLGTKLYIDGYGYAVAGDTGGAIKGRRIDLFMPDRSDALKWGRRTVKVTILD